MIDIQEKVDQVGKAEQVKLNAVIENKADWVNIRGRRYAVRWMRNCAIRKITDIMLSRKGHESQVNCKCAAAALLNDHWRIKLAWWAVWRWFYYVRQYRDAELVSLIELCKKKVDVESYYLTTTYLTGMKDTMMAMTRDEVERFLAAHRGEQ